jgi:hypothetical protein
MMKPVIISAFVVSSMAITVVDVINTLGGFSAGISREDNLTDVKTCIADIESVKSEITNAVSDIKAGGFEEYLAALKEFGDIAMKIPTDIKDCEIVMTDISRVQEWSSLFMTPFKLYEKITKNYLVKLAPICTDMEDAIKAYDTSDFYTFGYKFGDALFVVTE